MNPSRAFPRVIVFLGALLFSLFEARAQRVEGATIEGVVVDRATGRAIEHANIYLSSTTYGTGSGKDGAYHLVGVPPGRYQIVFSCAGYEAGVFPLAITTLETRTVNAKLNLRVITLGEVEVAGEADEDALARYRNYYQRFVREFIGYRTKWQDCTIANPEAIRVRADGEGILYATAARPVEIANRALGYTVQAELKEFSWWLTPNIGSIVVYSRFTPMKAHDRSEEHEWRENRCRSYYGSLMHFLASLYRGKAFEEGFVIQRGWADELLLGKGQHVDPATLDITPAAGTPCKAWRLAELLRVSYSGRWSHTVSYVAVKGDAALFDANGILEDPLSLNISGDWAKYRMSDMLPANILVSDLENEEQKEEGHP